MYKRLVDSSFSAVWYQLFFNFADTISKKQELKPQYTDLLEINSIALLDDRFYSKSVVSPASLQHLDTNGCVHNILTCRNAVDKSVLSTVNPFDVVQYGQIYGLQHAGDLL
jgi:hypothetical protein